MTDHEDPAKRLKRLLNSEEETQPESPSQPQPQQPVSPTDPTRASAPHRSTPPPPPLPALDKDNMPLPRRVDEIDLGSTRVSPAAYEPVSRPTSTQKYRLPAQQPPGSRWKQGWTGCFLRGIIIILFGLVAFAALGAAIGLYTYYSIARTLPSVQDLKNRASQFETTRIFDRNENLLYEILDPTAGRRTYVTLDRISPILVAATIATEDKDFYSHPGFDFWAILRALWQNYRTSGQGGGASTITQQLARALLLSPEERAQRTYLRKAR